MTTERLLMASPAKTDSPVVPICRIPSGLISAPNQKHFPALSRPTKRGVSRSSRTLGAGCDGRFGDARRAAQKRTAKSCGPGIPTLMSSLRGDDLAGDGGKKARSPGRARRKPLKPFAQGMPGDSGVTVVTNSYAILFCMRGCGCFGRPAFPAPSDFLGGMLCTTRAHSRREIANVHPDVIARSVSDDPRSARCASYAG